MPAYAQIDADRTVFALTQTGGEIVADDMIAVESLDPTLLGQHHDLATGVFTPPPAPPAVRLISNYAFLSRFTKTEAITIDLASIGATVEAAGMRHYLQKVNAAQHIDLDLAETREGVLALEAVGILVAGRALVILDAPITEDELP